MYSKVNIKSKNAGMSNHGNITKISIRLLHTKRLGGGAEAAPVAIAGLVCKRARTCPLATAALASASGDRCLYPAAQYCPVDQDIA